MKLKANFTIPTKDFKGSENVTLEVRVNFDVTDVLSGDPEYSVTMPDFMFQELADSEAKYSTKYDPNNRQIDGMFAQRTLTHKFMKTHSSTMLSILQGYFNRLTNTLNEKYSIERETAKKKIFISFHHSQTHTTNGLNSAYQGEKISQAFKFFTGYEMMTTKFRSSGDFFNREPKKKYISRILYASEGSSIRKQDTGFKETNIMLPLPSHNQSNESFEKEFSIIDWTPEREAFCEQIKNKFIMLNSQLETFLKEIDNDKFDRMIANNELKLLS